MKRYKKCDGRVKGEGLKKERRDKEGSRWNFLLIFGEVKSEYLFFGLFYK